MFFFFSNLGVTSMVSTREFELCDSVRDGETFGKARGLALEDE